jgi:opacity protein-like surface antigen
VFAGALSAQPVSVGLKFGVPLTDAVSVESPNPFDYTSSTGRWTLGPFVEIRLPAGFGLEVDGLYRSFDFRSSQYGVSVGEWDFPLLAKYRFWKGPVRPYIDGGLVFNHLSVNGVTELNHRSSFGIALGAGVDIHAAFLHISPEIRYEGFTLKNLESPLNALQSNRNQAIVMVGLSF